MHKNQDKNFAAEKQRKREKRTRKRPKRAKPGAFRVLEGMGTVENRGERMGKPSNRAEGLVSPAGSVRPGRSPLGCRPPRHAPQAGLRAHLVAKSYRTLTKKSGIAEAMPDFLAGAEGLEPSARGFGVDVGTAHRGTGEGRCWPVPAVNHKTGGAGLVLWGNFQGKTGKSV